MEPTLIELYRQSPGPEWFSAAWISNDAVKYMDESDLDIILTWDVPATNHIWNNLSEDASMDIVARRPDYPWVPILLIRRADLTPEVFARLDVEVERATREVHLEFMLRMPSESWTVNGATHRSQVTLDIIERWWNTPELSSRVGDLVQLYNRKNPALEILTKQAHYKLLELFHPDKELANLVYSQLEAIVPAAPSIFSCEKGELTKLMIDLDQDVIIKFPHAEWCPNQISRVAERTLEAFLDVRLDDKYTLAAGVCQGVSFEYIVAHPNRDWDWMPVCRRRDLRLSLVRDHPEMKWMKHIIACSEAAAGRALWTRDHPPSI